MGRKGFVAVCASWMLCYIELNRSLCRTSQSLYYGNIHWDPLRRAHNMCYFPKLIDCETLFPGTSVLGNPLWEVLLQGWREERRVWMWLTSVADECPGSWEEKESRRTPRLPGWDSGAADSDSMRGVCLRGSQGLRGGGLHEACVWGPRPLSSVHL